MALLKQKKIALRLAMLLVASAVFTASAVVRFGESTDSRNGTPAIPSSR